jgi:hypothetical protein
VPQLYHQQSAQGVWTVVGPPTRCAVQLAEALTITYGTGASDALAAHVPAVTSAGTTQVDRTSATWLVYVVQGDPTLRLVREQDQGQISGSYAPLARVLVDRVVPYQPEGGTAQNSSGSESYLPLTVTNNSSTQSIGGSQTTPVPTTSTDYVVQCHLTGSTAAQVWNALADKTTFTDLQVLFAGAEIDADLDQQTNGAWSSSTITLWFRLQRPIGASGTDQGYQLRMGGGLRSSPPRSWANIYPLADDFSGSSLGSSWASSGTGTLTVSGGTLLLSETYNQAATVRSAATFSGGVIATARAIIPSYGGDSANGVLGLSTGSAGPQIQSDNLSGSSYRVLPGNVAVGSLSSAYQLFVVYRDQANAQGGGVAGSTVAATGTQAGALYVHVDAAEYVSGHTATVQVDWIKVRPYLSTEPTVSAGGLQSAGPLVWQPVVDSSGSVLVDSSGNPIMALTSIG